MTHEDQKRRVSRRLVSWRVFYGSDSLLAEGGMLNMNDVGCHVAGCMPVEVGMRLRLCIWASEGSIEIVVAHGSVRWVKGLQFGLQFDDPLFHSSQCVRSLAYQQVSPMRSSP
jgi:hypothetical protein